MSDKKHLDYFTNITVSLVDTQAEGGYIDVKFPIPKQFIEIVKGNYKTFNGFTIDDDPEKKVYYAGKMKIEIPE